MESVKIIGLEIENVKRINAIEMTPRETGLTIIGGDNRQGKSSILDGIMSCLGGEKLTPNDALRDGAKNGSVIVRLSNDIVATRTFTAKGSYLKVDSKKPGTGQAILNEFINSFALNITQFLESSDKAKILMKLVGVDMTVLNERYKKLYDDRESIGRLATRAKAHAESMPFDAEAGLELITPADIMQELQNKIGTNAANAEMRRKIETWRYKVKDADAMVKAKHKRLDELRKALDEIEAEAMQAEKDLNQAHRNLEIAESNPPPADLDVTDIKKKLSEIDVANSRIRKNLEREKALGEAESHREEYNEISQRMKEIENEKKQLLEQAPMPIPELTVIDDQIAYKGHSWDCMSHAEQLMVCTAICRAIKPSQGFVLIDKLEAMDLKTLAEFGDWLQTQGLQAIATRVSKGDECSIIISDGLVSETNNVEQKPQIQF